MKRHSKYLESPTENNILQALKDILSGDAPYKEFSNALLSVKDIDQKINLENLISSKDKDIIKFTLSLVFNGIQIKLLGTKSSLLKFEVKAETYSFDTDDTLIKLLEQEPGLNQWIRNVFTIEKDKVEDNLAKSCSLIKKIDSMEALMSAKATAIKSFIKESKDKNRLQKMYSQLLTEHKIKLLSKVKLNNNTVECALNSLSKWFSKDGVVELNNLQDDGCIAQLKQFIENWKNEVTNTSSPLSIRASLGDFLWSFKGKFGKKDFEQLLNLNIWALRKNQIRGYQLSNILRKVEDGGISDEFLNKIQENQSVGFSKLWQSKDICFGQCLFKTIYELIRTSKNYKANDENAIKQAIKDVLKDGNDYNWFRNGLKTFFEKAKDNKGRTAKDIDVNQILEELPYFKTLLDKCNMELKFDSDQKELTFEEILEIEMNMKQEEKPEEAQPPKEEEIKKIAEKIEIKKEEAVILTKEENKKEEQPKENPLENLEEKKPIIEEKTEILTNIANDQLNNAFIEGNENDKTKKSKFPTWAKYLIGFGIAAVAVVAALFGFGVLGALAGTALMVARIVAVLAIFAELIYLAVLYAMSQDNKNPGGSRGSGSGSQTTEISTTLNKYGQSIENTIEKQAYPGKGEDKTPSSASQPGITAQYK